MTLAAQVARLGWVIAFALIADVARAQSTSCDNCGTITAIRPTVERSTWTPLGSVVPGSVVGDGANAGRVTATYEIGRDLKNQGMVLLGSAGGGAYAKRPNEVQRTRWEVTVKMDAGPPRVVSMPDEPPFQAGDRVRVYGTQLELVQP